MTVFLDDGDVRLHHGDVLDVLKGMPDESVDCVVTSPPYWGLRDYGNDGQLGLEETPDLFVAAMVSVFAEVRRVLAPHGTCWINLGDSYASDFGKSRGDGKWFDGGTPRDLGPERKQVAALKPKDLVGVPWRVAFALQADGWWLRSDIVWAKPNPMPESVTDRPTKSHEYVFLLTKQPRYYFDAEAVREEYAPKTLTHRGGGKAAGKVGNQDANGKVASGNFGDWDKPRTAHPRPKPQEETLDGSDGEAPRGPDGRRQTHVEAGDGSIQHRDGERWPNAGRNVRSVWTVATQPYPEAHFATYPEELVRRCVLAGCPERVCRTCGKASERLVEKKLVATRGNAHPDTRRDPHDASSRPGGIGDYLTVYGRYDVTTVGWSECGHNDWRPGLVLDPFVGSGTTCKVARDHGRHSVGIDLNHDYLELAARRLQQLSLLTSLPAPVPASPLEGAERSATP